MKSGNDVDANNEKSMKVVEPALNDQGLEVVPFRSFLLLYSYVIIRGLQFLAC